MSVAPGFSRSTVQLATSLARELGLAWGAPIREEGAEYGVVSQREGTFEKYMSSMMAAPIVGALAGNVLKHFRVELDYANQRLYVSRNGG